MTSRLARFAQDARRLSVGLFAIAAAAAVLLWADRGSRIATNEAESIQAHLPRIAVVQHASIDPLDDGIRGILDALTERGHVDGKNVAVTRYNAQGDFATANTIAKTVVGGDLDLIVTVSTISMQTVAAANRMLAEPKRHLFGITTDPFSAGIGVSRERPLEHPPYLAGVGSNSPIRELFQLVRRIRPDARRIGLVWNPAEANSEASTLLAREVVRELDMELLEGNAENSSAAGEVAQSVLARGVDLLWLSTDVTTATAQDVMIKAARQAGVPVIASLPGAADHGALLGFGSSYYTIGFEQGQMAADVLEGRELSSIPVINWTPAVMRINLTALDGLRDAWNVPEDLRAQAQVVIDATGTHAQNVPPPEVPDALKWQR